MNPSPLRAIGCIVLVPAAIAVACLLTFPFYWFTLEPRGFTWCPPSSSSCIETAKGVLRIGDDRETALAVLADAWYHGECGGRDVFLYGPRHLNKIQPVVVAWRTEGEKAVVSSLAVGCEYPPRCLRWCLPGDIFDSDIKRPEVVLLLGGLLLILMSLPMGLVKLGTTLEFFSWTFLFGGTVLMLVGLFSMALDLIAAVP